MPTQQNGIAQVHANGDTPIWVVTPTDEGFRVYAADSPQDVYEVTGPPDRLACTCPDFAAHGHVPGYRCGHIKAAYRLPADGSESGEVTTGPPTEPVDPAHVQMSLKRSVSPDGRIDSLSVEFTSEIYGAPDDQVLALAQRTEVIQDAIVRNFLGRSSSPPSAPEPSGNGAEHGAPATLTTISGMDTKVGWRYFINVKVGEKTLRLFGSRDKLAGQLRAAGYGRYADNIAKDVTLNLPCRAVTRRSDDGKYVNVHEILPPNGPQVPAEQGGSHGRTR